MDVWTAQTSAVRAYGEVPWSRCPDAAIKLAEDDSADDLGYQARHPGLIASFERSSQPPKRGVATTV
jgi:hypothetical protein